MEVGDEEQKRAALVQFENELRDAFDGKMQESIDKSIQGNQLLHVLDSSMDILAVTESEKVYRESMFLIRKMLTDSLGYAKEARIEMLNVHSMSIFELVELPQSEEYYKKLIENSYENHLSQFRIICENGVADFKGFIELAEKDRSAQVDETGVANIFINFLFVTISPMKRILRILKRIQEKLASLKDCFNQNDNHTNDIFEGCMRDLRALIRAWNEEESIIGVKRFDLLDAIRGSMLGAEDEKQIKTSMEKLHATCDEENTRLVQYQVYKLSMNDLRNDLERIEESVSRCSASLKRVSDEMIAFHTSAYLPTQPQLPLFI